MNAGFGSGSKSLQHIGRTPPAPPVVSALTPEELSRIQRHLRDQYGGVFDEQMIAAHIREYVESDFADHLARVIADGSSVGTTLLDIGSGYGAFVLACRRHGLDAVGLELAEFEVEVARARLGRAEPETDVTAVFRAGDAKRLPFPNATFEVVTLLNVLEHVPDYRAVLAEATRVLRRGGRLFIICPNYAALRREAHYHVPWLPLFPRPLASAYLRYLGRNPGFFEKHIYYCTNWGVLRALRALGLYPASLDTLRLDHPELISGGRSRRLLDLLASARMLPLLKLALAVNLYNPFKSAVTVVARKR